MAQFTPDEGWHPLAREFFELDDDKMTFELGRVAEKAIDRRNTTFSAESLDFINTQVTSFIGARLARRWNEDEKAPIKMRVHVSVEFGDPNQRSA